MTKKINIEGLVLFENKEFKDGRGLFFESFSQTKFDDLVSGNVKFHQDNVSVSKKNVLRGLHFQNPPYEQGKLVQVLKGRVLDVAVDIRKESKTYGQFYKVELSEENRKVLWIPPGFAHGFVALEDDTIFSYKCTNTYHAKSEGSLKWDDSILNIDWEVDSPILSDKDKESESFSSFASLF